MALYKLTLRDSAGCRGQEDPSDSMWIYLTVPHVLLTAGPRLGCETTYSPT